MDETETSAIDAELLDGRYRLVAQLGQGAYGEVWRATDTHQDVEVALKILEGSEPGEAWAEARRLTALESPNILRVHNASLAGDVPYLATALAERGTLAAVVQPFGVEPYRAVKWTREVASALTLCHSRGILHRDVKPDNIFLNSLEDAQLGDFGVAGLVSDDGTCPAHGDPLIRAPELFWGERCTVASDVWSLGATLYALLTGELPERDDDFGVDVDIHELAPHLSNRLRDIVRKATATHPDDRFATPASLSAALSGVGRGGRDFRENTPHEAHQRCWHGSSSTSLADVWVCVEATHRGIFVHTRYAESGRAIPEHSGETTSGKVLTRVRRAVRALS